MTDKKSSGSIAHAANILMCLSQQVHTISEISRHCQLGKSTVHRVLKLLEQSGLVMQDPINRNYYLGPLVTKLNANPRTSHEYLVIYALEEMKRLSRIGEETVMLDLMIGVQNLHLYEIPSIHDLKVTQETRPGGLLHAGASGRVHLSQLEDKHLRTALSTIDYFQVTDRTITSREVLLAQIKEIRKQGYAVSYGERNPGVMCLSVPILHYTFPATLSVIGPEVRLYSKTQMLIEEMKKSATLISQKLEGNREKPPAVAK